MVERLSKEGQCEIRHELAQSLKVQFLSHYSRQEKLSLCLLATSKIMIFMEDDGCFPRIQGKTGQNYTGSTVQITRKPTLCPILV